jgi:uncharacterized heparinase superfamily protein
MDIGPSPIGHQSNDYQSGALSFEIISSGKKLISNSGYFSNKQNKLNKLSKSTALQSTLVIEDYSSCSFKKLKSLGYLVDQGLKIMNKNIVFEVIIGKFQLHMMVILKNLVLSIIER